MNTKFDELIRKYLTETLTENERQLLAAMFYDPNNDIYLASKIDEQFLIKLKDFSDGKIDIDAFQEFEQKVKERIWRQLQLQTELPIEKVVQMPWYRAKLFRIAAIAASIVLVIGSGKFFFTKNLNGEKSITVRKPGCKYFAVRRYKK
jgi:hypothetical protein